MEGTRKNLKGYRQKPSIYGLNTVGFIISATITVLSLLSFLNGISVQKIIVIAAIIGCTYLISFLLSSNESINEWLFDEKLPKEFSDDK
ncbi:hypothetical protein [Chryseobacterium balustinum]|uniref:Uncharacterized protein n=1 Tax=Chryseobacterium balustinum TaxID=246 RepID=A0ABY1LBV7_9FLAO|nr:hypothetical protein [Chryseobacterium balustinum]AZB32111.1 hypothetical protein EB354_22795 [Chryseobacterium balustinum]SKB94142.1 hypothetical protein SAMN05421800_11570 [Chryseobacterium balustinum]